MDIETVVYINSGILSSHKEERNSDICNEMDETRGHCAKWKERKAEKERHATWFHLYVKSKKRK